MEHQILLNASNLLFLFHSKDNGFVHQQYWRRCDVCAKWLLVAVLTNTSYLPLLRSGVCSKKYHNFLIRQLVIFTRGVEKWKKYNKEHPNLAVTLPDFLEEAYTSGKKFC